MMKMKLDNTFSSVKLIVRFTMDFCSTGVMHVRNSFSTSSIPMAQMKIVITARLQIIPRIMQHPIMQLEMKIKQKRR